MIARATATRIGLLLAALILTPWPSRAGFTIRDLGLLASGGTDQVQAINAIGEVAGSASFGSGSNTAAVAPANGPFHALPGVSGTPSAATGIDLSGNVAGTLTDPTDRLQHGFTVIGQAFHELGPLTVDGHAGGANQINGMSSSGEVVGTGVISGRDVNGVFTSTGLSTMTAFRALGAGTPTIIQPLGSGRANFGNGINSSGTVVGGSEIAPGGPVHAFSATQAGAITDLTLNRSGIFTSSTEGNAINDIGDVVGDGLIGNQSHAFFASHAGGSLVDLGLLGGTSSIAHGVNNSPSPLVVGEVDGGAGGADAFLWSAVTGMVDLHSLLSSADQLTWTLSRATAINDADQIVGTGLFEGQMHAFLLAPVAGQSLFTPAITPSAVPAPPALVMVSIGGILAGAARIRRGRTAGPAAA